ncbi:MAG: matrixin family metalloprotease [Armatimonadota bacterium]
MNNHNQLKKVTGRVIKNKYAVILLVITLILLAYSTYGHYRHFDLKSVTFEFIPGDDIDRQTFEEISRNTGEYYGIPYKIADKSVSLPESAYKESGKQYDAEIILKEMDRNPSDKNVHRLLITVSDLGYTDHNFIFGLGYMPGTVSVMSLARLNTKGADNSLVIESGTKIAVHELGHTIGFNHCSNEECVMYLNLSALSLDNSDADFCDDCKQLLK